MPRQETRRVAVRFKNIIAIKSDQSEKCIGMMELNTGKEKEQFVNSLIFRTIL